MDKVFSKENKTLKKYWKIGKKILEKSGKSQGILSVRKSGNPVIVDSLRAAQMADCNYLFVVKNPQVTQMLMYDLAHCSQA